MIWTNCLCKKSQKYFKKIQNKNIKAERKRYCNMIERNTYLKLLQKNMVYPMSVKVWYEGNEYYPLSYIMWFNHKGETQNSAEIMSVKSKTVVRARLLDIGEKKE